MFSQTVEYALRAMTHIGENPNSPQTTQEIAAVTHIPPAYLAKVLRQLAGSGLLHGQRGLGGGFSLDRDPKAITLLEVVSAVEPICRIVSCPLQKEEHDGNLCLLHKKLDGVLERIQKDLGITTLEDVIQKKEAAPVLSQYIQTEVATTACEPKASLAQSTFETQPKPG